MHRLRNVLISGVFLVILANCDGPISYKLQIIPGPVEVVAQDRLSFTDVRFYAYNNQTDFMGYEISVGATKDEALAFSNTFFCPLTLNTSNSSTPTMFQFGGTEQTGYQCFLSSLGPLSVGTWVSIRSKRNCSTYINSNPDPVKADPLQCQSSWQYSAPSSSEVLSFIDSPAGATLETPTDTVTGNVYYLLNVTMPSTLPTNLNGVGLFYSSPLTQGISNSEEAIYKASKNGSIRDGFCNLTSGVIAGIPTVTPGEVVGIQIGGTQISSNKCYIGDFYLISGDTLVVRNSVDRVDYPWSDYKSVVVP